jgi:hypothetical protein
MSSYVEDDVIPPMRDQVMNLITITRKATSAIRSAERGWDWYSYSTKDGAFVEAIQVDPEDAQKEINQLMLDLLYIHNDDLRSKQRT